LRSAVHHRSTEGLFALLKERFSGMHGDVASRWHIRDEHWRRKH
jgi:hypothetical protein